MLAIMMALAMLGTNGDPSTVIKSNAQGYSVRYGVRSHSVKASNRWDRLNLSPNGVTPSPAIVVIPGTFKRL